MNIITEKNATETMKTARKHSVDNLITVYYIMNTIGHETWTIDEELFNEWLKHNYCFFAIYRRGKVYRKG